MTGVRRAARTALRRAAAKAASCASRAAAKRRSASTAASAVSTACAARFAAAAAVGTTSRRPVAVATFLARSSAPWARFAVALAATSCFSAWVICAPWVVGAGWFDPWGGLVTLGLLAETPEAWVECFPCASHDVRSFSLRVMSRDVGRFIQP